MRINVDFTNIPVNTEVYVQAHSRVRTIVHSDIIAIIKRAETRLKIMGVAKTNQTGIKILYENSHKMPSLYRGRPESTQFVIERGTQDWFLTVICRADCNHNREISFINEHDYRDKYTFGNV